MVEYKGVSPDSHGGDKFRAHICPESRKAGKPAARPFPPTFPPRHFKIWPLKQYESFLYDGKDHYLGNFDTPKEAARAFDAAVRSKGGKVVNFPNENAGEVKAVVGEKKGTSLQRSAAAAPSTAAAPPSKQPRLASAATATPAGLPKVASPKQPASAPPPPPPSPLKQPQPQLQPLPLPDLLASLEGALSKKEAEANSMREKLQAQQKELAEQDAQVAAQRTTLAKAMELHAAKVAAEAQAAAATAAAQKAAADYNAFAQQLV